MMFKVQHTASGNAELIVVDGNLNTVEPASRFLTYLSVRGCSPNTISAYAYDLAHLWTFLTIKGWAWDSLSAGTAVEFLAHLRSARSKRKGRSGTPRLVTKLGAPVPTRLSAATINRVMVAVSSFYDWAILTGAFAGTNPIRKVEDRTARFVSERHRPFLTGISRRHPKVRELRVKTAQRLPRPMNDAQLAKLIDELQSLRDKSLIMLMLNAGLRPGEVLSLHLEDIAYGRRRLIVRCRNDHPKGARSKSRTERVVDLHDGITLSMLSSYVMAERPREATSPFVFLVGGNSKRKAEPMSYAALVRLFARACERAQIREPRITPHALRHTHATKMWEAGMRELTLQRRLGHSSPESTRIYTRVSDAAVVAEYRRALGLDSNATFRDQGMDP
jgi:site-specific recombinase XerD